MIIDLPGKFAIWRDAARRLGFTDFVSAEDDFRTSLVDGGAWAGAHETGLYFWIAEDGETYVGQTVNARSRLLQHRRTHPDLSYASFQALADDQLNAREAELIEIVGRSFATRNIKHALQTRTHVPFDDFVSEIERHAFLDGTDLDEDHWRALPLLERKQARKFDTFLAMDEASSALGALATFIRKALPKPATTEARFWSVSLCPAGHLLRVNAGQQEVFTVTRGREGDLYAWALALDRFGLSADGPLYQTASYACKVPLAQIDEWLTGRRLRSCRSLVVQLMRHTTTLNSGSHCPQAVRYAGA